jgi:hypothetical protein
MCEPQFTLVYSGKIACVHNVGMNIHEWIKQTVDIPILESKDFKVLKHFFPGLTRKNRCMQNLKELCGLF